METLTGGNILGSCGSFSSRGWKALSGKWCLDMLTGFFQMFVKNAKYDNRYLIVNKEGKTFDLAYSTYGLPVIIDGTARVTSPQDMHFWKPEQICGKSVAYVETVTLCVGEN